MREPRGLPVVGRKANQYPLMIGFYFIAYTRVNSLNKPLIQQCQSWNACIKELSSQDCMPVDSNHQSELKLALIPAVSLAWYLSSHCPELLSRQKLTIWIIGAELIDARDQGGWYQCLTPLLDIPEIQVRLIGPKLEDSGKSDVIYKGTAEELLQQEGIQTPDVAVMFQPGFEEEDSLLASGAISRLLKANCIVIGSSYSDEEYQRDRLMAEAYGFELVTSSDNPFSLDPAETGLHWADRMWSFSPGRIPDQDELARPDQALIESVQCLSRMTAHSRVKGIWAQPAPMGSSFEIPDTKGGTRTMIHIMDSYYLDPASGRLYGVEEGRLRPMDIQVSEDDVEAFPGGSAPMPLALWAAGIKSRYLVTGKKPTH